MKKFLSKIAIKSDWDNHYSPIFQQYLGDNLSFKEWCAKDLGVTPNSIDEPLLIVSITSTKPRTYLHTWLAIESIFKQTKKPNRVILNLPQESHPNGLDDVPKILKIQMARGLEIDFYSEKTGIIFPLNATVVTFEDDWVYPANNLNDLWQAHLKNPKAICAHWARRINVNAKTHTVFPFTTWEDISGQGCINGQTILCMEGGGILYPHDPTGKTHHGLHASVTGDIPKIFQKSHSLWWFLKRVEARTPVVITKNNWAGNISCDLALSPTAYPENWENNNIDDSIAYILKEYPSVKIDFFDQKNAPEDTPPRHTCNKIPTLEPQKTAYENIVDRAKICAKKIVEKDITRIPCMAQYDWDSVIAKSHGHDTTLPKNIRDAASDVVLFRRIFDRHISINGTHYALEAFKKEIQAASFKYLPYANVFSEKILWQTPPQKPKGISVIAATNRPQDIKNIIANFKRQVTKTDDHHFKTELVIVPNGGVFNLDDLHKQVQDYPKEISSHIRILDKRNDSVDYLADCLNYGIQNATYDLATKTDGDDIYGPNYLMDLMRFFWCTGADLVGCRGTTKYTIVISQRNGVAGRMGDRCVATTGHIAGGTITFSKKLNSTMKFRGLGAGSDKRFLEDFEKNTNVVRLRIPHFNYIRTRSKNIQNHTCRTTISFKKMHMLPILHGIVPGLPPKLDGLII